MGERILVTRPLLPDLKEFEVCLEDIWGKKWITNNGKYHETLEIALSKYLDISYLSLFTNGTLPLITALQAMHITGEVITTPYSFVATTHAIWWNNIKPVFIDIDPETANINPDKIKSAISSKTTAILPVHIYGNPCDVKKIKEIAEGYGLKVIYDAAHAFGVRIDGKSILEYGDMSTLSFHATKVFNTVEGGALISHTQEMKQYIDCLRNFGFEGETTVVAPGINCKMDELRAAYGLLNLKQVDKTIAKRKHIVYLYREGLRYVNGIRCLHDMKGVQHNYAYFPIFVNEKGYGMNRDALYEKLKENNIYGRRYFYPLISNLPIYHGLKSADPENLPCANKLANEVICLPIYPDLKDSDVEKVLSIIKMEAD